MSPADHFKFNWGQTVRIRPNDLMPARAGALAEVCGIMPIQTLEHARSVVGGSLGEVAYLVEFDDGTSLEVVGHWLEAV